MHLNANDHVRKNTPAYLFTPWVQQAFRPHQRPRPSPPPPKIDTNNQVSALVVLAEFDSAGGLIPSTAPAGDASLTPLQPITAAVNVEM